MKRRLISIMLILDAACITLPAATVATAVTAAAETSSAGAFSVDSLRVRYNTYASWCCPEKLFLHVDRTYYAAGETIWFKGYLRNANGISKFAPGNFIYAEILGQAGNVLSRAKIKRDGDGFPGHIQLPDDIRTGNYTLRAYTIWQLNSSEEYMFTQKLKIIGADGPAKEPPLKADTLDVTFYPEGGRYFNGLRANVAFKVMDSHGRSVEMFALLKDDKGMIILPTSTRHDGMGMFSFVPEPGRTYLLEDSQGRRFPLPAPLESGATVGIRATSEKYLITAISVPVAGESAQDPGCTLFARDRENILPLASIPSDGKPHNFVVGKDFFNSGVNHLLVVDHLGNMVAERLFYVYEDETAMPACNFSAKLPSAQHGLIRSSVTLADKDGALLDADLSMAVVRGSFAQYVQDDNLLSYMGLSSELKGRVNNPAHYFDTAVPQKERAMKMDLLMMVQGWRYYDLEKIMRPGPQKIKICHTREYSQTISGRIERSAGKKMPEKFIFAVMIPNQRFNQFVSVEKANRFTIDSLDFEESTPFLISTTRSGMGFEYVPKWSGDVFAPSYKYAWAPGRAAAATVEQKIPLFSEVVPLDTLQAAVVTAGSDDFLDASLDSKRVGGDDFKTYATRTLVEYLTIKQPMFEYDGEDMYNRRYRGAGAGKSAIQNSDEEDGYGSGDMDFSESKGRGLVKLVEDNTVIPWWNYEQLQMDEIQALSISTNSDSFYNAEGGVVMIKVLPGGRRATKTDASLLYFVPLGYQKPAKFYSPRYDLGDKHEEFDHRNTIYWDPCVRVRGGKAEISFCDTDQQDYPYVVTIQGYTSDGKPVSLKQIVGNR